MTPATPPPAPTLGRVRRAVLGVAVALLGAGIAWRTLGPGHVTPPAGAPPATLATLYPTPRPLPPFTLTAHDGSRFDRARLGGHYTLLFLGYTRCPDVCPTTLLALAAAERALGAAPAALPVALRPMVAMLTVDPARDSAAVLARYVAHFDARFLGVRGADPELKTLATALGAVYAAGTGSDGVYRVEHTAAVFLIDRSARLLAVYTTLPAATALAADYTTIVRAAGGA